MKTKLNANKADGMIERAQPDDLLFQHNPLPMWVYDLETYRFLSVNHAAVKHYGYSEAEFLALTIKDIRPAEDVDRLLIDLNQKRPDLQISDGWRHRRKDGSVMDVEIHSHTLEYNGRPAALVVALDLTERKKAEEARRESEERFHRLAENAPDLIYRYDLFPQRGFSYVNPSATSITGYTPEEHYADPELGFNLIHPDDRHLLEAAARGEVANGQPLVLRWVRKDGKTIWTEQRNVPVFDSLGKMIAIEGIARDITLRKQVEDDLIYQAQMLAEISDAVVSTDSNFNIRTWNKAAEAMFGYTAAEMIGKPGGKILLLEYVNTTSEAALKELNTTGHWDGEVRLRNKDGSVIEATAAASILRNAAGAITGFLAVNHDITERKQFERALAQSQAQLEGIINSAIDAVITIDEEQRILLFNPSAEQMYKCPVSEALGQALTRFVPEYARGLHGQYVADFGNSNATKRSMSTPTLELTCLRADGELFPAEISISQFELQDRKFYTAVIRDITERKQAEKALVESEERLIFSQRVAHVGHWTWDIRENRVAWSDEMKRIFGLDPATFDGDLDKVVAQSIHPDDREKVNAANASVTSDGKATPLEYRVVRPDQSVRTVWAEAGEKIVDKDGNVIKLSGIVQDITERKQAEQTLRASEDRYRDLVENIHDLIGTHDLDGNILSINAAAAKLLGVEDAALLNMNLRDILVPEVRGQFDDYLSIILRDGQAKGIMYVQTASGERRIWDYDNTLRSDTGGAPIVRALARDVTESRQAEASLRLQSAALEATVNSIVITDREGVIQWANSAYARLTGYTLGEVLGKNPRILSSGLHDKEFYKTMWDTILSGKAWHGELINRRKDGSLYNDEMTITPLVGENGEIAYFIGVKQDITERKKNEDDIRQRVRELETVNHISVALRASSNRAQALAIMLEETMNVFNTRHGAISLWNEETETLREEVARGWLAAITERPIRAGEGIFGTVFASGETHISDDFASDPLTLPRARPLLPLGWGGLCVPIRTSETILGVLTVAAPSQRVFHHEDIRLLETLAEMAGTALHRMSLNEEVQRHLERLQALRQIDMAISGNFDRRATLQTILTQVISQLGVSAADILMLDSKTQNLYLGAYQGFVKSVDEIVFVPIGESFAGKAVAEKRMVSSDLQAVRHSPEFYKLWNREGFSNSHAIPLIAKDRPIGVLEVYQRTPSIPNKEWFNFLEALAGQAAIALENAELFENLETANAELTHAYDATIEGWSHAMDLRDKETEGHTQRVTALTLRLAHAMGVSPAEMIHIRRGALLHDIGKMGVPDSILLKPDKLTEEEWEIMRKHPTFALEMLQPIHYLKPALNIPYSHHEKWDGSGYPRGLAGEQIPLEARIFAVVDVWDALTSDRPYRPAWSREKALHYIREQSGTQFDPAVVEAFLSKFQQG